jgi:hypothetical protein
MERVVQGAEEDIGPRRDEVTAGWRKLHNEELRGFYSSPSIMKNKYKNSLFVTK